MRLRELHSFFVVLILVYLTLFAGLATKILIPSTLSYSPAQQRVVDSYQPLSAKPPPSKTLSTQDSFSRLQMLRCAHKRIPHARAQHSQKAKAYLSHRERYALPLQNVTFGKAKRMVLFSTGKNKPVKLPTAATLLSSPRHNRLGGLYA